VLSVAVPRKPIRAVGVLLLDEGRVHVKFRDAWDEVTPDEDDQDYLAALADDIETQVRDHGAEAVLNWLEDSLSGFLRISEREQVPVVNPERTLQRLFDQHVDNSVRRYVTHLPVYSLRAAATRFGEAAEVEEIEWLRAPEGLRVTENMFIAQVVGRSMEPLIPDGSYCIFRSPVVGSRQNRRLLIQEIKGAGSSSAFTIKRYTSRKQQSSEDEWQHESIRLEPLNPEFEAFELAPDVFEERYRVIAEFVQVLD